ncbi:hypothetical protein FRB99_001034 [Tulasnella sp. 403]|nr:hypothetical protein FRB99_001034 [Tulasnella sp. 403]
MTSTSDEYEDQDDIHDLAHIPPPPQDSSGIAGERLVRKRSSKACDNCRKAKCKCERSAQAVANGEPGPPKGYIDALESKLHQLEALLGTIITSTDIRARSLIYDLSQDPLALEIIQRVNDSPFGSRGRKQAAASRELYGRSGPGLGIPSSARRRDNLRTVSGVSNDSAEPRLGFMGPPHDWQDALTDLIASRPYEQHHGNHFSGDFSAAMASTAGPSSIKLPPLGNTPSSPSDFSSSFAFVEDTKPSLQNYAYDSGNPHQRRRIDAQSPPLLNLIDSRGLGNGFPITSSHPQNTHHTTQQSSLHHHTLIRSKSSRSLTHPVHPATNAQLSFRHPRSSFPYETDESEEDLDLADAVGQLSINEQRQLRYHGKASGLHLLMSAMQGSEDNAGADMLLNGDAFRRSPSTTSSKDRNLGDVSNPTRINGGIWEFPPPGVWPPVPKKSETSPNFANVLQNPLSHQPHVHPISSLHGALMESKGERSDDPERDDEVDASATSFLPDRAKQEELLGLYFTYVHPILPLVHKRSFLRDFAARHDPSHPDHHNALHRVPNVLLLAMFAISARFTNEMPVPDGGQMWTEGCDYFRKARQLIVMYYSLSRPETVQALLLMGYREIGLGSMAQAWLYVGLAVRVAQDLGMHRSLAKWKLSNHVQFTPEERETRSRIWHACMRMDRYVSTYIGRPLSTNEHDYDTQLPEEDDEEENEPWVDYPSMPAGMAQPEAMKPPQMTGPSRTISCFKASITLSKILGTIVFNLYAIRAPSSSVRHRERIAIEQKLEKWMLDLPDHLRYNGSGPTPSPAVLTLHMQYWCTVLLLNRPFIRPRERHVSSPSSPANSLSSEEINTTAAKAFSECQKAALHITNIAVTFAETFCPRRAPAIFTYYIFTASIMHVTSLMENPVDIQASLGLQKAMDVLKRMSITWPSAGRAWDLLDGVKIDVRRAEVEMLTNAPERKKRPTSDSEPFSAITGLSPSSTLVAQHLPSPRNSLNFVNHVGPLADHSNGLGMQPPVPVRTPPTSSFASSPIHESFPPPYMDHDYFEQVISSSVASSSDGVRSSMDSVDAQHGQFHAPVPSYTRWMPDSRQHPQQQSQLTSIPPLQPSGLSFQQQPPRQEHYYSGFSTPPVDVHSTSYSTAAGLNGARPQSQPAQLSFVEGFTPSPVPSQHRFSNGSNPGGGMWGEHHVGDPFEDATLHSAYPIGGTRGVDASPTDATQGGSLGTPGMQPPGLTQGPPLPTASSLNTLSAYFGNGPSGSYFGAERRLLAAVAVTLDEITDLRGLLWSESKRHPAAPERTMVSKLTTPEQDEAVNTLLALGTDLDEQGAIALLKKHRWDVEKAASDMFNEPPLPPPREYLPPSPDPNASGNATAAWDKSKQYDGKGGSSAGALVTTTTASASSSTATLGASGSSKSGALNVPSAIVPSQPRRRETIDLTGDDEEEQMRKAMAASLEDNTPQEAKDVPVYGPRLPGEEDTQIWRPNAGMSQEDQALSLRRHDGPSSERTPLSYPARLFLDPYLWENRALVGEKLRDIERCFEDIEKIGKVAEYFSAREDKDPTGDLKQTIHYLENVADPKGDAARAERLKEMAGKLKETLARIEEQLGQCSQRTVELRNQAAATLQVPELQRRPYDLRAVLVHDGLIGREHMYAYLRDQRSGKWFKSWDAFAEEVPEATVLNDSSGLHLNSGPYFFLYSEALPEDYDMSENHWPVPIMELLQEDNAVFRRELPLNVAEELEERDLALRSLQPPLASSTLSSATDSAAGTPPPVSSASPQVTMPDKDSMDTSR